MSYDITIKADDDYSKGADIVELDLFLISIAGMNKQEQGCHFGDPSEGVYFEIDAYRVNREGNLVEHSGATGVNRVDIHIPTAFFDATQQKAAEVSCAIAAKLGWNVFDEQTGKYLASEKENLLIGHQALSSAPLMMLIPVLCGPKWIISLWVIFCSPKVNSRNGMKTKPGEINTNWIRKFF